MSKYCNMGVQTSANVGVSYWKLVFRPFWQQTPKNLSFSIEIWWIMGKEDPVDHISRVRVKYWQILRFFSPKLHFYYFFSFYIYIYIYFFFLSLRKVGFSSCFFKFSKKYLLVPLAHWTAWKINFGIFPRHHLVKCN